MTTHFLLPKYLLYDNIDMKYYPNYGDNHLNVLVITDHSQFSVIKILKRPKMRRSNQSFL